MSGRVGGDMGPNKSVDDDWCVKWYILRRAFTADKKMRHNIIFNTMMCELQT